jgi:hypothetical protein
MYNKNVGLISHPTSFCIFRGGRKSMTDILADKKSSQTQISQATLDVTNQAVKVNVVAGGGAGGATEVTAVAILAAVDGVEAKLDTVNANLDEIETATESIDTKTPALESGRVPVALSAGQISTLTPQTNALTDTQLRASAVPVSVAGVATETTLAAINTKTPALISGASPVVSGLGIVAHDAVAASFGATTDTYQFFQGGLAGTLVSTVVISYTDATKAVLQSVVRT